MRALRRRLVGPGQMIHAAAIGIAALIVGSSGLLAGCGRSGPIEAVGGFYPVAYAPGVLSGVKALSDAGRSFEPEGVCLEQSLDDDKKGQLTPRDFSHARGRLVSIERELAEPLAYRSYGRVDIRNTGPEALTSVAIEGPFVGEFSVLITGETMLGRFAQKIPVGSLPSGAIATVTFWTDAAPSALDVRTQTRVTHAGGRAEIAYESESQGPRGWLSRRVSLGLALNLAVSLVTAIGLVSLLFLRRRT